MRGEIPRTDGADVGGRREPRRHRSGTRRGRRRGQRADRRYDFQDLTGGAGGIIHDRPQGGLTALIFAARQGSSEAAERTHRRGRRSERDRAAIRLHRAADGDLQRPLCPRHAMLEKGASQRRLALHRRWRCATSRPTATGRIRTMWTVASVTWTSPGAARQGRRPDAPYIKTIPPRQAQGNINVPAGATPLYRAVRAIDLAAVQLLVDRGANPSPAIKDGSTPLMAAAGTWRATWWRRRGHRSWRPK